MYDRDFEIKRESVLTETKKVTTAEKELWVQENSQVESFSKDLKSLWISHKYIKETFFIFCYSGVVSN